MLRRSPMFTRAMRDANRDGTKTQTRRPVKRPERLDGLMLAGEEPDWAPYGKPGDIWAMAEPLMADQYGNARYADDGPFAGYVLCGDTIPNLTPREQWQRVAPWQWKRPTLTSSQMPIWAARTFLMITGLRIERVQDISEADAVAGNPWVWAYTYRHATADEVAAAREEAR